MASLPFKTSMKLLVTLFILIVHLSSGANASTSSTSSTGKFSLDVVAGLPQLIGVEVGFTGIKKLQIGAGFGFLPVNSILGDKADIPPQPLNATFSLDPSNDFSMIAPSAYIRFFPTANRIFLQLSFAYWQLSDDISGDLLSLGFVVMKDAVTGKADVKVANLSLIVGYKVNLKQNLFFSVGAGVSYLLSATSSIEIGGDYASVASVIPGLSTEFEIAKQSAKEDLENTVEDLKNDYKLLPVAFVNLGITL